MRYRSSIGIMSLMAVVLAIMNLFTLRYLLGVKKKILEDSGESTKDVD